MNFITSLDSSDGLPFNYVEFKSTTLQKMDTKQTWNLNFFEFFWNYFCFSETFLHIGWIPLMKKENKSGALYMSVLEQGAPQIRVPPTLTLTSPYFQNTPMT
jgi:hypothetical protein